LHEEPVKVHSPSSEGTSKKKLGFDEMKDTVSDDLSKTRQEEQNDDDGKEGADGDLDQQIQ